MRESIALFMSNVHKSVNEMSQVYLTNERRYNYTTPKSFLEQIKLYQNLLQAKFDELQAKTVRLENGLEKLKSTSAQASVPSSFLLTAVSDSCIEQAKTSAPLTLCVRPTGLGSDSKLGLIYALTSLSTH